LLSTMIQQQSQCSPQ